jgi:hypothetical protein
LSDIYYQKHDLPPIEESEMWEFYEFLDLQEKRIIGEMIAFLERHLGPSVR